MSDPDTSRADDAVADPDAHLTAEDAGSTTDPAELAGGDTTKDPEKASDLGG